MVRLMHTDLVTLLLGHWHSTPRCGDHPHREATWRPGVCRLMSAVASPAAGVLPVPSQQCATHPWALEDPLHMGVGWAGSLSLQRILSLEWAGWGTGAPIFHEGGDDRHRMQRAVGRKKGASRGSSLYPSLGLHASASPSPH